MRRTFQDASREVFRRQRKAVDRVAAERHLRALANDGVSEVEAIHKRYDPFATKPCERDKHTVVLRVGNCRVTIEEL